MTERRETMPRAFGRALIVLLVIFGALIVGKWVTTNQRTLRQHNDVAELPAPQRHVKLRLKWLYDPGFAGEMIAARDSLFAKRGITVDIRPGGFEADPITLVASGSDDIGVTGADNFLFARDKGVPIVAFAAGYIQTPVAYYVLDGTPIQKPQQFVGKRVGYQSGQDTGTIYEALLRTLNIKRENVREVPVKYDLSPLLTHQVDVWPGYRATQAYTLEQQHLKFHMILPETYGLHFLGTVYFATEKTIRDRPAIIQAFVDGLIDGWQFTYDHSDSAISAISAFDSTALRPALVASNLRRQHDSIVPPGRRYCEFTPKDWETTSATLTDLGMLKHQPDLTTAVEYRFLAKRYGATPE